MESKYRANDIAAWLIQRDNSEECRKNNEHIDTLKLMKLLYYAQGAFLAIDGVKLFSEEIRAWEYGPAVEEVYNVFKGIDPKEIYKHCDLLDGHTVEDYDAELLEEVYQEIGKRFTGTQLITKTHREEPWLKATNNGRLLRDQVISAESIKEYFEKTYTEFRMIEQYLRITGGKVPECYKSPEEEAHKIKRCSILKDVNFKFSYRLDDNNNRL